VPKPPSSHFLLFHLFFSPTPVNTGEEERSDSRSRRLSQAHHPSTSQIMGCAGCGSNSNERIGRVKGESGAIVERERGK